MKEYCPLCKSKKNEFLLKGYNVHGRYLFNKDDVFDLFHCLNCGCIFVGNVDVNQQYYKKYYGSQYYSNSYSGKFIENLLFKYSISRKEKFILKNFIKKTEKIKILDIGCGDGNFLSKLESTRFKKYGVEISEEGYELSVRQGIEVFKGDFADIDFQDKKFEVITLWHVLEHIEHPVRLFSNVSRILEKGGVLIFETPNVNSFGFRYGGAKWFHLDSPRHLILYNLESVKWLCGRTNFKISEVKNEFYDYPLDLFWSLRATMAKFFVYPLYLFMKIFSKESLTFICRKG
ncbi:MAG: hypothetical protein DRP78_03025 [Candidatus Omnitrophota bacterium]|nr:MAG: hypothetical protein DRP78_03025 [Candidatus Omnitrophota bacterium]